MSVAGCAPEPFYVCIYFAGSAVSPRFAAAYNSVRCRLRHEKYPDCARQQLQVMQNYNDQGALEGAAGWRQLPGTEYVPGHSDTIPAWAWYRSTPAGHMEAGFRRHGLSTPFPQESGRWITVQSMTLHIASTARIFERLRRKS